MDKKVTAVEWLFSQLPDHLRLSRDGFDMLQQANEMAKNQIIEAYKAHHDLEHIYGLDAEHYYQQTYGE